MEVKVSATVEPDDDLYFTADWHFGDDRMAILGRPFASYKDCAEAIVKNANATLNDASTVIVNGDVAMSVEHLHYVAKMPGRKLLVIGNKDVLPPEAYREAGFDMIVREGLFVGDDLYVTHYPSRAIAGAFNIVGHIHSAWRVQKNMLNVGVDANHFLPVSLRQVIFAKQAICNFYDDDVWVANHPANTAHALNGVKNRYCTDPICIEGDLLDFASMSGTIAHQANCVASSADACGGLAYALYTRFPWAMPETVSPALFGSYQEMTRGDRTVVNLYGQLFGGGPSEDGLDTQQSRLAAMKRALFAYIGERRPDSIALPYKIGCGIAGGDWHSYYELIRAAGAVYPRTRIYLVKLPTEQW